MHDLGYIQDYRHAQQHWHQGNFRVRADLLDHWSYGNQVDAFIRGHMENWSNPNTTDIHGIKHVKNLAAYLSKYLTKCDDVRPIEGRLWGCSDRLRSVEPITIKLGPRLKAVLMQLAEEKGSRFFGTDFNWTLWRFDSHVLFTMYPVLSEIWSNFSRHCIRYLYPKLLADNFFDSLVPEVRQERLQLVEVYG
jgi:hypothetical protein